MTFSLIQGHWQSCHYLLYTQEWWCDLTQILRLLRN